MDHSVTMTAISIVNDSDENAWRFINDIKNPNPAKIIMLISISTVGVINFLLRFIGSRFQKWDD